MKIIDEASSKSASRLMFAYSCFAFAVFKIKKRRKRKNVEKRDLNKFVNNDYYIYALRIFLRWQSRL